MNALTHSGSTTLHNEELNNLYSSPTLLGLSNQGGWEGRGMQYAWERREMHTKFNRKTGFVGCLEETRHRW
jgi:hypothetical protein